MKRLPRIIAALLLLPVVLSGVAWLGFPWYAQSLLDRSLHGTPFSIKISGVALPDLSGVKFRSLEAVFTPPPDPCSGKPAIYRITLHGGTIALDLNHLKENRDLRNATGIRPINTAALAVTSDSLLLRTMPDQFTFIDRNPRITILFGGFRGTQPTPSFRPLSVTYPIQDAQVRRDSFLLSGVNYSIKLLDAEQWQQPRELLTVRDLYSEGKPLPLNRFRAFFTTKRDPFKPCVMTLDDCSLELFTWKASAPRIEYDMKNNTTGFILNLAEIPLADLPGFKTERGTMPFAAGNVNGLIPVVFSDSTIMVRDARVFAEKGATITWYTRERKPWLSADIAEKNHGPALLKNINAAITLKRLNNRFSGLVMSNMSASMLGGTITSAPFSFDPSGGRSLLTLKLNNIDALDRVTLHGDFRCSLKGRIGGTVPIGFEKNGFSISNARIQSPGGGTVSMIIPQPKGQSLKER
ncbi:MAG: hypothetical protein HGA62_11245, partial [Chlorobiaceae bacterium]|nr:hypothetical protein [Chlorobiaceae bacterium]